MAQAQFCLDLLPPRRKKKKKPTTCHVKTHRPLAACTAQESWEQRDSARPEPAQAPTALGCLGEPRTLVIHSKGTSTKWEISIVSSLLNSKYPLEVVTWSFGLPSFRQTEVDRFPSRVVNFTASGVIFVCLVLVRVESGLRQCQAAPPAAKTKKAASLGRSLPRVPVGRFQYLKHKLPKGAFFPFHLGQTADGVLSGSESGISNWV